jgi:hypothetical protein
MKILNLAILFALSILFNACNESTVNPTFGGKTRMELLTSNSWIFESSTNFGPKALIMKFNSDMKFEYYDQSGKKFLDRWAFTSNQTQIYNPDGDEMELTDIIELTDEKLILKAYDGSKNSVMTYTKIYNNPIKQDDITISGNLEIKIPAFDYTKYAPVLVWSTEKPTGGYIFRIGELTSASKFILDVNNVPDDSLLVSESIFKMGLARIYVVEKQFAKVGLLKAEELDDIIFGGIKGHCVTYYTEMQSDSTIYKRLFQLNKGYNLCKILPDIPDFASIIPISPKELTLVISTNPSDIK